MTYSKLENNSHLKSPAKVVKIIQLTKLNYKIMKTLIINFKESQITLVISKDEKNVRINEKHYHQGRIFEERIKYCVDSNELRDDFDRNIKVYSKLRDDNKCTLIIYEL